MEHRIIVISGPAGSGKTRLAEEMTKDRKTVIFYGDLLCNDFKYIGIETEFVVVEDVAGSDLSATQRGPSALDQEIKALSTIVDGPTVIVTTRLPITDDMESKSRRVKFIKLP